MKNKAVITISSFLLICIFHVSSGYSEMEVIYPRPAFEGDHRHDDVIEILKVALEKTVKEYGSYNLAPNNHQMTAMRQVASVKTSKYINVFWGTASKENEQKFITVSIPLRKGMLSYRIMLIPADKQELFDSITTLDELKKIKMGQGLGWQDVQVYRHNGVDVHTAKYENLFKMIDKGRLDAFPRGVGEVFSEYQAHSETHPNIAVEKRILLYYPWPYYFVFNKHDEILAKRVEDGLLKMIEDGSFDEIFEKYNADYIKKAGMAERRVIELENPLLPDNHQFDEKLWFKP